MRITLPPYILACAAQNQAYGIMYVWADPAVDRHIMGWDMPVTWEGVFDGAITIVGVLIANAYWKRTTCARTRDGKSRQDGGGLWRYGARLSLHRRGVALLSVVPVAL